MTLNPKYLRGCVLAFDFAELSGNTVYDLSGHGNHGTIYGASWRKGPLIGSLYFDGENDYVEVPHSDELMPSELSIEVLFYPQRTGSYDRILEKGGYKIGGGYGLEWSPDGSYKIRFNVWEGGFAHKLTSAMDLSLNTWWFVTATFDGVEMKLYINAELDSQGTGIMSENTWRLAIGVRSKDLATNFLNALIAFVRIYNRTLTEKEIREHYYYVKNMISKPRFPIFYRKKRTSIVPALA